MSRNTDTACSRRTTIWHHLPRHPNATDLDQPPSNLHVITPNPDGPDDPDDWIGFLPTADTDISSGQYITADPADICTLDGTYR